MHGVGVFFESLIDIRDDGGQQFAQCIANLLVSSAGAAEGIAQVAAAQRIIRGEFAHEIHFVSGLGEGRLDGRDVRARHREDMRREIQQIARDRTAAEARDVHAHLREDVRRVTARGVAGIRADACGEHFVVRAVPHQLAEDGLGHRTAAGVAGADKEDSFQSGRGEICGRATCRSQGTCQRAWCAALFAQ